MYLFFILLHYYNDINSAKTWNTCGIATSIPLSHRSMIIYLPDISSWMARLWGSGFGGWDATMRGSKGYSQCREVTIGKEWETMWKYRRNKGLAKWCGGCPWCWTSGSHGGSGGARPFGSPFSTQAQRAHSSLAPPPCHIYTYENICKTNNKQYIWDQAVQNEKSKPRLCIGLVKKQTQKALNMSSIIVKTF